MSARMEKVRDALRELPVIGTSAVRAAALAEGEEWEARVAELEVAIEKALLLLTRIDHDEGSRIGRAIEALEKTCR